MKDSLAIIGLIIGLAASAAIAQIGDTPPFFSAGATGYEAVISTTVSGSVLGASVSVSADHKYATIGAQSTLAGAPNFTPFSISTPTATGFVGGAGASSSSAAPTVLDRPGMTLITPLQP
jgi:hypothetical protein